MSNGYNWVRSKDCEGLIEMEKGKLKRELISEFLMDLDDIQSLCTKFSDSEEYVNTKIKKWEEKLK